MFPQNLPNPHKPIVNQANVDLGHDSQSPGEIRETLIKTLLLVPLDPDSVTRIQLGDHFRRSLQSQRSVSPYRLHTIIGECKAGTIDKASLEARFFQQGGAKAVTCLAAAATDNKQIIPLLTSLSDGQLQCFISSIELITPHRDLLFIAETLERKKPPRLSKRRAIPSVRTRRKIRRIGCPEQGQITVVKSAIGKHPHSMASPEKQSQDNINEHGTTNQCTKNYSEHELRWSQIAHRAPRESIFTESVVQSQHDFKCPCSSTTASVHVPGFSDSEVSTQTHVPSSQFWESQNGPFHSANMLATTENSHDCPTQPNHRTVMPEEQMARSLITLEEVSAAASYIDENKFEHYGVDLDLFNAL